MATKSVGLRLTESEFALLWAVLEATNQRLRKEGVPAYMNVSRLIKMLLEREGERLGVLESEPSDTAAVHELATAARQASPRRAPLARRLPPAGASGASRAAPPMDAEFAKRVLANAAGDHPKRAVGRPGLRRRRKRT